MTDCGHRTSATSTTGAGRYRAAESHRVILRHNSLRTLALGYDFHWSWKVSRCRTWRSQGEGSIVTGDHLVSGKELPALSGGATASGHWSLATSSAGVGRCRATMQSADIGRDLGRKVQAADFREGGVSYTSGFSSCAKSLQGGEEEAIELPTEG